MLKPFIPQTSSEIQRQIMCSDEKEELVNNAVQQFKAMINKEYGQELLEIVEEAIIK